ncbi:hypothetical protein OS493_021801 [Desmophyllum pertusum]|uniref:Uncharacterized protein n=1 Tax=Desmophyllum pertusum TaxID=174260 RepID=A0A9W9ZMF7_9CNID|nr:hypothetical protein OS493_021801 [Desmophyllum pertusum]
MFMVVCSAYRLNRHERGKFADQWANKEGPERDFYGKFGILHQNVMESPQRSIPLPRPYVNPNKNKYTKKRRPTTRPHQETSASELDED